MKQIAYILFLSNLVFVISACGQELIQNAAASNDLTLVTEQPLLDETDIIAEDISDVSADLFIYAKANRIQAIEQLLEDGANVSVTNNMELTPLHVAALNGNGDMAELFLAHGADINARDYYGLTPLHLAAQCGHIDTIKILLFNGANIHAKTNDQGLTPLHWAALWGYTEGINTLLKNGADINAHDNIGDTPLAWAEAYDHYDMARLLARRGGKLRGK